MTTGIILAGGKSIRLGKEKAFIQIKGKNLIEHVVACLQPVVNELVIVTNEEKSQYFSSSCLNSKIVVDIYPNKAALGGLYTGLVYSNYNYSIVVACDMPFLNTALLEYMLSTSSGYDAVVPKIGYFLEPLHAVYSKNCLEIAKNLIRENKLTIRDLIEQVRTRFITEDEMVKYDPGIISFFNVNNEKELKKAKELANKLNN